MGVAAEKHFVQVHVEREGRSKVFVSLYIPLEGSRNYSDDTMSRHFEMAGDANLCGGGLGFRGSKEDRRIITGEGAAAEPPSDLGGWRREAARRERAILRAWAFSLQARPGDIGGTNKGYMLDYIMVDAQAECGGYNTLPVPPGVASDHFACDDEGEMALWGHEPAS